MHSAISKEETHHFTRKTEQQGGLISLYLITIYFNTSFLILFMFAMPTTRSLTVALNPPLVPPLDALNPLKVELDGEEVLVFACRPRSALHLCVRSVCVICVCVRSVCLPFVFVICVCDSLCSQLSPVLLFVSCSQAALPLVRILLPSDEQEKKYRLLLLPVACSRRERRRL